MYLMWFMGNGKQGSEKMSYGNVLKLMEAELRCGSSKSQDQAGKSRLRTRLLTPSLGMHVSPIGSRGTSTFAPSLLRRWYKPTTSTSSRPTGMMDTLQSSMPLSRKEPDGKTE